VLDGIHLSINSRLCSVGTKVDAQRGPQLRLSSMSERIMTDVSDLVHIARLLHSEAEASDQAVHSGLRAASDGPPLSPSHARQEEREPRESAVG